MSTATAMQEPMTGYAPVNGLRMYYEIHGEGDPIVLLHGSYMTITSNWAEMIPALAKSRQVIAVELQGHGRTADIDRDLRHDFLADDVAALLDYLEIERADLLGYSMGGGVAMQVAIRHPAKVRKVVSLSAVFHWDGWVPEVLEGIAAMKPEMFAGTHMEVEYRKLSPTPDGFVDLVRRIKQMNLTPYDFGAEALAATTAPMFFVHGDADGVRLDHIAEMCRLKGGEVFGDMRARAESRLAVLPDTTHVTLRERTSVVLPMVNDFLDAKLARNRG